MQLESTASQISPLTTPLYAWHCRKVHCVTFMHWGAVNRMEAPVRLTASLGHNGGIVVWGGGMAKQQEATSDTKASL